MTVLSCWLQSSLYRVFPTTPPSNESEIRLLAARNERTSFQVCLSNGTPKECQAQVVVEAPGDLVVQVRRVGFVPMQHH